MHIRSQRWRVLDVHPYTDCQLIAVVGVETVNGGIMRRFLQPFDIVGRMDARAAARFVSPRRWRRACRGLLAASHPPGGLRTARYARIDLLPHQLEPALAVIQGKGTRALLADEVGLGKTIQAGLIISELKARGMADRVLILTPAGLRRQWAQELAERFDITGAIVDDMDVRRRVTALPVGVNPWSTIPAAIVSVDYVKRPDILPSVLSCTWDVVVIDEAHGCASDSDRHAAVRALALRAPYVLMLTATPHNGEPRAFKSLLQIGARTDPILIFRRSRAAVRPATSRHIHHLHVQSSPAERDMHDQLAKFTQAVRLEQSLDDAWLPLSVFHKRALSCARALQQSADRRLQALPAGGGGAWQLLLPLADFGEIDTADEPPNVADGATLADNALERRLLEALRDTAAIAALRESKFAAIARLARRVSEPMIVFTEYRDTLLHLRDWLAQPVAILHGGLTRDERTAALDEFTSGRRRMLLTTDAAGEGLNLQRRCRIVINLELPWNPMRLEQRIGRVDRIGQQRTVHVFHLIARDSGEDRILQRLTSRLLKAGLDIAVPNPVAIAERDVARLMLAPADSAVLPPASDADGDGPDRLHVDLAQESRAEARRIAALRALAGSRDDATAVFFDSGGPWAARARLRRTRASLGSRVIALFKVDHEDGHGRFAGSLLVPLAVALAADAPRTRTARRHLLQLLSTDLAGVADAAASGYRGELEKLSRTFIETRLTRERCIREEVGLARHPGWQAGLFDRRAERLHTAVIAASNRDVDEADTRLARWDRAHTVTARSARFVLALLP